MTFWTTHQIRQAFTTFFQNYHHTLVPSSPLVPHQDDTLLFVNAGMVPFKNVFLGNEKRNDNKAVSVQKCLRAGGKHNDLENVGYTARHHTFFEMLGNFSFGDYFKHQAITYAWEFLTQVLQLPPEKLWITVYQHDAEAKSIWLNDIGVDPQRFSEIGAHDNFWSMGDTGPCGPCSEIFYDHGSDIAGGPPGSPEEDGDRFVEIWNLVFMQYNRLADGTLENLPNPSVDTGMGLERIAAVMQSTYDNFKTDVFQTLIEAVLAQANQSDHEHASAKVVADHIRAISFLIADGVFPQNEGRGYVLRRIIRRAARHGYKLGIQKAFLSNMVPTLVDLMGQAYPQLVQQQSMIQQVIAKEEQQFRQTLTQGMAMLEKAFETLKDQQQVPGELAFKLYDTYGFPIDLTADIARERDLTIDYDGFDSAMEAQRQRAKAASQFKTDYNARIQTDCQTQFVGYETLSTDATVDQLLIQGADVTHIDANQEAIVILNQTPFYAESGGQVADQGVIKTPQGALFQVTDVQQHGQAFLHHGYLTQGSLTLGAAVQATVETQSRINAMYHHTATHLLHAALRERFGQHIEQKGSLVQPDRLRFDFSHLEPLTKADIAWLEQRVNAVIRQNIAVEVIETTYEKAREMGAMALFGEKYGDHVRVLKIGDFSIELCGGTHVARTGDIGLFKITESMSIASGVRRVEAVTGWQAQQWISDLQTHWQQTKEVTKAKTDDQVVPKIEKLYQQIKQQQQTIDQLKAKIASGSTSQAINEYQHGQWLIVTGLLPDLDAKMLRKKLDDYKSNHHNVIVIFATHDQNKVQVVAGVGKDLKGQVHAGTLVQKITEPLNGKGGGRWDMAQGGGMYDATILKKTFDQVNQLVVNELEKTQA